MLQKLLAFLTGAPVEQVGEYFRERQRLKHERVLAKLQGKVKAEEAKWRFREGMAERDHDWGMAHIRNSGWKDEYVLLILSIPLPLCFVPGFAPYILAGFDVLSQTPPWYVALVVTVFLAIYGIRARGTLTKPATGS